MASPASAQSAEVQAPTAGADVQPGADSANQGGADQVSGEDPAAAADDGTIVVTGFRGSLQKALSEKRTETVAVDSILAEDIGKFPDLNRSDSIQRIPGVALARDGSVGILLDSGPAAAAPVVSGDIMAKLTALARLVLSHG